MDEQGERREGEEAQALYTERDIVDALAVAGPSFTKLVRQLSGNPEMILAAFDCIIVRFQRLVAGGGEGEEKKQPKKRKERRWHRI